MAVSVFSYQPPTRRQTQYSATAPNVYPYQPPTRRQTRDYGSDKLPYAYQPPTRRQTVKNTRKHPINQGHVQDLRRNTIYCISRRLFCPTGLPLLVQTRILVCLPYHQPIRYDAFIGSWRYRSPSQPSQVANGAWFRPLPRTFPEFPDQSVGAPLRIFYALCVKR